jgi:hypothetical protein
MLILWTQLNIVNDGVKLWGTLNNNVHYEGVWNGDNTLVKLAL